MVCRATAEFHQLEGNQALPGSYEFINTSAATRARATAVGPSICGPVSCCWACAVAAVANAMARVIRQANARASGRCIRGVPRQPERILGNDFNRSKIECDGVVGFMIRSSPHGNTRERDGG